MRMVPLGDRAVLLTDLPAEPWRIAAALNESPPCGMEEAVAAYDSVALHIDPDRFEMPDLGTVDLPTISSAKRHVIPVCYELGLDIEEAARNLGLQIAAVVDWHANRPYACAAVGFRPGFAYLGPLPAAIAGLPRRQSPRLRLEAGSVGVTGTQTGVYPQESPGGWWILGRTPLCLVDPDSGYYPIQAGDEVVFVPIGRQEFEARQGERL